MGNAEYCFSEKLAFFQNVVFFEKVDAVQKYLLRIISSSVDIFILNNSSAKKVAVLKRNYPGGCSYGVELARLGGLAHLGEILSSLRNSYKYNVFI